MLDTFAEILEPKHIPVFGGSSSSSKGIGGAVGLNGQVYERECVFIIFKLIECKFFRYQEDIYRPMGASFLVTCADVETRTIYELDGHPVSEVLSRTLGVSEGELQMALRTHPLGRTFGTKLFATDIEGVNSDGSITTLCRTYNQTRIELLELTDLDEEKKHTYEDLRNLLSSIEFSIIISCTGRVGMFKKLGVIDEYKELIDTQLGSYVGMSGFGEYLDDYYLNISLILLAIGASDGEE